MENRTSTSQSTTNMRTFSFDGMPVALASLHEKCQQWVRRSHAHAHRYDGGQQAARQESVDHLRHDLETEDTLPQAR